MNDKWLCCWHDENTPQIVPLDRVVSIYHNGKDDYPYEIVVDATGTSLDAPPWSFYAETPCAVSREVAANWLRDETERITAAARKESGK